jgi:hypothetical protein
LAGMANERKGVMGKLREEEKKTDFKPVSVANFREKML